MISKDKNYFLKNFLILILSLSLILFTQWVKIFKNPESMPITANTFLGLLFLGTFAFMGILTQALLQKTKIKFLSDFPILGWVIIISLFCCLLSNKIVEAINAVDFLSLTTPVLTYAGISVANRLTELRKMSWKIAIVGVFVFLGTYLGSGLIAEIGFRLLGK